MFLTLRTAFWQVVDTVTWPYVLCVYVLHSFRRTSALAEAFLLWDPVVRSSPLSYLFATPFVIPSRGEPVNKKTPGHMFNLITLYYQIWKPDVYWPAKTEAYEWHTLVGASMQTIFTPWNKNAHTVTTVAPSKQTHALTRSSNLLPNVSALLYSLSLRSPCRDKSSNKSSRRAIPSMRFLYSDNMWFWCIPYICWFSLHVVFVCCYVFVCAVYVGIH